MNTANPQLLQPILEQLVDRAGAHTALLITRKGTCDAVAGMLAEINTTAVAALIAGVFSATREVARLVGERHFSILLQQGERRHIHISLVDDSYMLVVIFEDDHRIGRVRLEARRSSEEIARALDDARDPSGGLAVRDASAFKEYALDLIDRIFETD